MAKQALGIGAAANDNTGDTLRDGGDKINDNFNEIYSAIGNGTDLNVAVANPALNQVLKYTSNNRFEPADYNTLTSALDVNNNSIISSSNGNITIAPNGGFIFFPTSTITLFEIKISPINDSSSVAVSSLPCCIRTELLF